VRPSPAPSPQPGPGPGKWPTLGSHLGRIWPVWAPAVPSRRICIQRPAAFIAGTKPASAGSPQTLASFFPPLSLSTQWRRPPSRGDGDRWLPAEEVTAPSQAHSPACVFALARARRRRAALQRCSSTRARPRRPGDRAAAPVSIPRGGGRVPAPLGTDTRGDGR